MKMLRQTLRKRINPYLLTIIISVISLLLVLLELLLTPWDDTHNYKLKDLMFLDSLSLLDIIYVVVSLIALFLSIITTIRSQRKLRRERERLDTMLSYLSLVNQEKALKDTKNTELLMRREWMYLQQLDALTNKVSSIASAHNDDVEATLDNARDAVIKLKNIS